jgi:ribonuclease-3
MSERAVPATPVEIFHSHSSVEAEVVRGLLDAHGIRASIGAALSSSIVPMPFGQARFSVSVPASSAAAARDLIASHLDEAAAGEVRRLSETLGPLETRIGHKFRDLGLLEHALTHRSRAHEDASGGVIDNESLEFLGDAVLGFVIADMLFQRFPTHSEGYKSKVKASIVSATSLTRLAETIDLGQFVLLGRGEEKTGGRRKHAILADSFEALIAAIYLDGGVDAARAFIVSRFGPLITSGGDNAADASFTEDWKSALQEWLQKEGRGLPQYRLASAEGPDHRKRFDIEVVVAGESVGRAPGAGEIDGDWELSAGIRRPDRRFRPRAFRSIAYRVGSYPATGSRVGRRRGQLDGLLRNRWLTHEKERGHLSVDSRPRMFSVPPAWTR